ncbi:photosystem reaction center subunit H [Pseudorhizobium endolithicum]|uniref:Photosystem reaction center subunit H n=1 Tax=Pseudorhizobium endolithicum TaxID=1191678 RepID=A0ABM8PBX3_9HYPH|nr:PRC-barrel domain-containing protein [Pseudorhizobium endolithicum]CAD7022829.1 photosystem reaction center subunit H [Pseudorhizobium endolithicum]
MAKRLLPILLMTAAFPMAAMAQTAAGESGTTITNPGAAADQNAQTAPDAAGGTNDAKPMEQASGPSATTEGPFVTVPETGAWRVSDLEGKEVYGTDGENIGSISDVLVSQDGSVNAVIIGVGGFLGIGAKDVAVDMNALELGPGATQAEANAASAANPEAAPGDVSGETTASTGAGTTTPPAGGAGTAATGTDTAMTNDSAAPSGATTGNTTTGTGMPATGDDQMASAETGNDGNDGAIMIGTDGLPERIVLNVTRQQLEDAPAFEGLRSETPEQQ